MDEIKPKGKGGRPKGSQNKVTAELKQMILGALDDAGGQKYLLTQAHDNPKAFLALLGRVLPTTLNGELNHKVSLAEQIAALPIANPPH